MVSPGAIELTVMYRGVSIPAESIWDLADMYQNKFTRYMQLCLVTAYGTRPTMPTNPQTLSSGYLPLLLHATLTFPWVSLSVHKCQGYASC